MNSFEECFPAAVHFRVTEPSSGPNEPFAYFHSTPLAFASGMTASASGSVSRSSLPVHRSNSLFDLPLFSRPARFAPNSAASSFGSACFGAAVWAPAEPHPASISNAADAARHFDSRFMIPSIFSPVTPPWPDLGEQPTTSPHSGLAKTVMEADMDLNTTVTLAMNASANTDDGSKTVCNQLDCLPILR